MRSSLYICLFTLVFALAACDSSSKQEAAPSTPQAHVDANLEHDALAAHHAHHGQGHLEKGHAPHARDTDASCGGHAAVVKADDGEGCEFNKVEAPTAVVKAKRQGPEDDIQPGDIRHYGAQSTLTSDPISLPAAIKNIDNLKDQPVRIAAKVDKVCSTMGCWMTLKDESIDTTVRVRMKDHAFLVPRNASGADIVAEGVLSKRRIPKELLEHYAKETPGNSELPTRAAEEYIFTAFGVDVSMPQS